MKLAVVTALWALAFGGAWLALAGCQTVDQSGCTQDCSVVLERGGNEVAPATTTDLGVLP
jgi:hypothetical protein